jgi:hypothetical protein
MKILRINDPDQGGAPAGDNGAGEVFSGGGDEGGAGSQPGGTPDPKTGVGETPSGIPSAPVTQPQLTPEGIAAAIKAAGLGQPAHSPQPEKQYTQEDFDKAFNVFNITPELLAQLRGEGDLPLKALIALRDGLNKQSVTMASYIAKQVEEKLREEFAPVQTHFQEQQVEKLYNKFFTENEGLKPYDSICKAVVAQMQSEGVKFDSQTAAFKALADRVRLVVQKLPGSNGQLPAAGSPAPTRMPPLSRGGQGGTGKGTGGTPASKDPSHSIFG